MITGKLNFKNGLFLGREELNRQQQLADGSFLSLIKAFGPKGVFNLKEKYEFTILRDVSLTIDGSPGVLGIDINSNPIFFNEKKLFDFPYDETTPLVYVSVSALSNSKELGTVSISTSGIITGVSTHFTECMRNYFTKKPLKIYLHSDPVKEYTIQSVTSDVLATVLEPVDIEVNDCEFSIIGTFSPFVPQDDQATFPFTYYSYELSFSTSLPNESTSFLIGQVTWDGVTPVYTSLQNKASILGSGLNENPFDYVVDSDSSLAGLRGNSNATNVLIKSGTWTYDSPDGKGIVLHPNTKLVWAEEGSLLKINSDVPVIANSFAFGYLNFPSGEDNAIENVNIENSAFLWGFNNLQNLTNCTCKMTYNQAGTIGYYLCERAINCKSFFTNVVGSGFSSCTYLHLCKTRGSAVGFTSCLGVLQCFSGCATGFVTSYASMTSNPTTYACADTANGGFNYGNAAAPPSNNNNLLTLGVLEDTDGKPKVTVTAAYAVASEITITATVVFGSRSIYRRDESYEVEIVLGSGLVSAFTKIEDINPEGIYSISTASHTPTSDGTYTYVLNY